MRAAALRARAAWASVPSVVRLGWKGGLLAVVGAMVFATGALPLPGSADTYWHLDYTYQLSHLDLPEPRDPEWIMPGSTNPQPAGDGFHLTASHPPLFYTLSIPVLGPLYDNAPLWVIVYAARMLNMTFAVGLFAAVAWLTWNLGGRLRDPLTIAAPALVGMFIPVSHAAGDYYNDILLTLFAVVALGIGGLMLRDGPSRSKVIALSVVSSLGMATKATFLLTLVAVLTAMTVATLWHGDGSVARRVRDAVTRAALVIAAPIVFVGWFYYRNYTLSGSPLSTVGKLPVGNRTERTLSDVVATVGVYDEFPSGWFGVGQWSAFGTTNHAIAMTIVAIGAALTVIYAVWSRPSAAMWWFVAMLAGHVIGLQGAQMYHAIGWGQIHWRYYMQGAFALAALMIVGALGLWRRLGPVLVAAVISVTAYVVAYDRAIYVGRRFRQESWGDAEGFAVLPHLAADAGLPWWPLLVPAAIALVGLGIMSVSLYRARQAVPAA